MKYAILTVFCCLLLSFNFTYGDTETKADDEKREKESCFKLKEIENFTEVIDSNFLEAMSVLFTVPLRNKPKNLEVPEKIKAIKFAKLNIGYNSIYVVFAGDDGKMDKLYVDTNMNAKIDEDPIDSFHKVSLPDYLNITFNVVKFAIKDKSYHLLLSYTSSVAYEMETQEKHEMNAIQYCVFDSYTTECTIHGKSLKMLIIDIFCDGKISSSEQFGDFVFLDKNGNGKFEYMGTKSELLNLRNYVEGGLTYKFKFDLKNKTMSYTTEKVVLGQLKINVEGASEMKVSMSAGLSFSSPTETYSFKDSILSVPCGKYIIKNVSFIKDGKNCSIDFRSFSKEEAIEILKNEVFEFALDLHFIFRINPYDVLTLENDDTTITTQGYVYNYREVSKNGKKKIHKSQVQLRINNSEFAPPKFTVKDSEGKVIVKETIGKPFC